MALTHLNESEDTLDPEVRLQLDVHRFLNVFHTIASWPVGSVALAQRRMEEANGVDELVRTIVDDQINFYGFQHAPIAQKAQISELILEQRDDIEERIRATVLQFNGTREPSILSEVQLRMAAGRILGALHAISSWSDSGLAWAQRAMKEEGGVIEIVRVVVEDAANFQGIRDAPATQKKRIRELVLEHRSDIEERIQSGLHLFKARQAVPIHSAAAPGNVDGVWMCQDSWFFVIGASVFLGNVNPQTGAANPIPFGDIELQTDSLLRLRLEEGVERIGEFVQERKMIEWGNGDMWLFLSDLKAADRTHQAIMPVSNAPQKVEKDCEELYDGQAT